MGYVFDFQDAKKFEQWMDQRQNKAVSEKECRLMIELLNPLSGKTILDIGCGIGLNFFPLLCEGLQVTGLDASPYMLDIASKRTGNRVDFHRGYAEELPFDDNTFNYACMTTTLEFVEDPKKALEEACRVARDRIYIGILNRYAINSVQLRVKGIFTRSLYNRARFFSIWELKRMIRSILGDVPISWRSLCHMPESFGETGDQIGRFNVVRKCPFGAVVGIVVSLVPRYKTTPLPLQISHKRSTGEASG